jgi:hypothetical protein
MSGREALDCEIFAFFVNLSPVCFNFIGFHFAVLPQFVVFSDTKSRTNFIKEVDTAKTFHRKVKCCR